MLRERTLTLADYRRISDSPENSGRLLELIDGEIVEKMGGFTPSQIAWELAWLLKNSLAQNRLGYLTGEGGGYIMSAEQSIIFIPDIAFISYEPPSPVATCCPVFRSQCAAFSLNRRSRNSKRTN
ncbi:MAG: Uma2 family endonuclease [Anaerolineae bacterium]|nr:Uma2 family endonuclease [Anaerolineae bacterium]NUQ06630.1 Uma2 family endonuclease [Anaerolineae bacterium]